jgi:signal transduction histidine kinase
MDTRTIIIHSLIHDLKVPLAVIELGVQSMLAKSVKSDLFSNEQIENLQAIRKENARAIQLTNRLLNKARIESPIETFFKGISKRPILKSLTSVLRRQSNSTNALQEVLNNL